MTLEHRLTVHVCRIDIPMATSVMYAIVASTKKAKRDTISYRNSVDSMIEAVYELKRCREWLREVPVMITDGTDYLEVKGDFTDSDLVAIKLKYGS